ncbi:MAG: FtsX-like permease family protein [Bacteroidetes bacterium]|nr:MAG: FtsX-like permease family protein [Bacteroidota bacterium]
MNRNYLKIAWRILMRNKVNTAINILGLGLGFSISILMMIYVWHQQSFDKYHSNYDRISRMVIDLKMPDGTSSHMPFTAGDIAGYVKDEVPSVEAICRFYDEGTMEALANDKRFPDQYIFYSDAGFFQIFDLPLIAGDPQTALAEPNTLVLTRKLAERYFGDEDPMDKTMWVGRFHYRVTGVAEDLPPNSHLQFEMLASFSTITGPHENLVERSGISFFTYLLRHPETDAQTFELDVARVADHYANERFGPRGLSIAHSLQPLSKIFLHSNFTHGNNVATCMVGGDIRNVYVFSFLALVIVIIAVFNFVNLITVQSEKRAREIGMRKVMGAQRKDMVFQFIGESLLLTAIAFVFSLMLNELLIQPFSRLLDENFRLAYWQQPGLLLAVLGFVLLIGVLAGLYPALYLSRFKPVKVLKGVGASQGRTYKLRKVLVGAQFAISIFLVVSVLLLNRQVNYMKHKDIGFDRENMVTLGRLSPEVQNSYPALEAELLQNPSILAVTASMVTPGRARTSINVHKKGEDPKASTRIYGNLVNYNYIDTYRMQIVEGEDFHPRMRTDVSPVILNQAAVRQMGLENPIGQEIIFWNEPARVIGVVQDYNFLSMHHVIEPLMLVYRTDVIRQVSLRISAENMEQTLTFIRERFEAIEPDFYFDPVFIDDAFAAMYRKEERTNQLVTAAALLAIIISFMGLYALTSFSIIKRIKEIGIRKTLGASAISVILLLLSDLRNWILLGNLVAWPVAFYVVSRWLENFAFRIELWSYWYLFVLAGILAALVGMGATFIHAWGALKTNPAISLKAE